MNKTTLEHVSTPGKQHCIYCHDKLTWYNDTPYDAICENCDNEPNSDEHRDLYESTLDTYYID